VQLTVVVMSYNEAAGLQRTIGDIKTVAPDAEILVIDDGSTDDTPAICAGLSGVRVVRFPANRGLGAVYRTGFAEATGDALTFWPADGQFPASIIPDFRLRIRDADLVLGTIDAVSALSAIERLLYRLLFGHMPKFQGVMMVRVSKLREVTFTSTGRGWTIVMELILRAHRAGWRIVSVPTAFLPRTQGRSKVRNFRTIVSHLTQLVALRRALN
jgi:glycosyltransferase involved in cell wall biosynthesis